MVLFSADQLADVVRRTLPLVPAGHNNAVIGTVDDTGAQVVLVMKLGDQAGETPWTVSAVARHEWSGANEVGASVVYSWASK